MRFVVAMIVIVVAVDSAWACPASNDPNWRCTKYDFMYEQLMPAKVYVRDERGAVPRRARNVMAHLTSSGWHSRSGEVKQETLQLFDGANVPETYEAIAGARQTFVHQLEKVDHQFQLQIDGYPYRVMRCKEDGRTRTCLVRT